MKKKISWFENVQTTCDPSFPSPKEERVYGQESIEVSGRIINTPVIKTSNPSELLDSLHVTDFCLENVIAAGAVDTLQETSINASSISKNVEFLDSAFRHLNDLSKQIETTNT